MSKIVYFGKFKKSSTSTEAAIVAALSELDHDVTCVDYPSEELNPYTYRDFDLALFSKCEPYSPEQIEDLRCRKAVWVFDSLHDTTMDRLRKGWEDIIAKGRAADWIFTAAPGDIDTYRELGCNHIRYLPQACDHEIFWSQGLDRDIDISFVGNNYGSHRRGIIGKVHERYGDRFKLFSKTDTWGVPVWKAVSQEGAADVFSRSKITLNMSETPEDDKWSRRVWDAMGCGAVVAAQHCPSFSDFFSDNEMVTWTDVPSLFDVVDRILDNEKMRQQMSSQAAGLMLDHHTYKHRVQELLDIVEMRGRR